MKRIVSKYKNLPLPVRAGIWFMLCSILQMFYENQDGPV